MVRKGREVLREIPSVEVERIVLFGNVHLTTPLVAFALKEGIDVVYLDSHGGYRGRLQPPLAKDGRLRRTQYKVSLDTAFRLELAKGFVQGKLRNMAALCRRQRRAAVGDSVRKLEQLSLKAERARDLEGLRGYEGAASAAYYKAFRSLLKQDFGFKTRTYHPPPDPVNALLSLGYTLLYNEIYSLINVVGLDPYLGFFHEPKHGHAALASDLMEEWRPVIVDSLVLFLVNRGEIEGSHFRKTPKGQIRLTKEGLSRFVAKYEGRLRKRVYNPRLRKKLPYRACLESQVRHLADRILGKTEAYRPFRLR